MSPKRTRVAYIPMSPTSASVKSTRAVWTLRSYGAMTTNRVGELSVEEVEEVAHRLELQPTKPGHVNAADGRRVSADLDEGAGEVVEPRGKDVVGMAVAERGL